MQRSSVSIVACTRCIRPGRTERQRLERVRPVLQQHADQQGFDWLMLAALAFKESTLNPSARGASGRPG